MKVLKKIKASLLATASVLLVLVYPWVVTDYLNPPPCFNELKYANIKVQQVGEASPTLKTTLPNGKQMDFDLPPNGYSIIQGFPRDSFLYKRKTDLLNCSGAVGYDEMRFLFFKKASRIWSLSCGSVSVSFQDSLSSYEKNKSGWIDSIALVFGLLLCLMFYYADWLKK